MLFRPQPQVLSTCRPVAPRFQSSAASSPPMDGCFHRWDDHSSLTYECKLWVQLLEHQLSLGFFFKVPTAFEKTSQISETEYNLLGKDLSLFYKSVWKQSSQPSYCYVNVGYTLNTLHGHTYMGAEGQDRATHEACFWIVRVSRSFWRTCQKKNQDLFAVRREC